MYWQLQSDMYFRMAGGWTGISPFDFDRMPVANYFYGGIDLPEPADQLKAYITRFGVQAVIADPIEPNFESFKQTLDSLGVAGLNEKGVWIYKIPRDSFAAYAKLPSAQAEARANALRFDAILEAAGKYLADGRDLSKLSALELKQLDLLPHDWLVDATPHAYFDWEIGPAARRRSWHHHRWLVRGNAAADRTLPRDCLRDRLSRAHAMDARFASAARHHQTAARDVRLRPARRRREETSRYAAAGADDAVRCRRYGRLVATQSWRFCARSFSLITSAPSAAVERTGNSAGRRNVL